MKFFINNKYNKHILAIVTGAVILCFMALYNTFPMTFNSDSATYLNTAFSHGVTAHRPILYGLFMIFVSLGYSLWLVIGAQALIVSLVVYYFFAYFTPAKYRVAWFICYITLISFFMGGSFNVSWLMPDVFTPVCIMCMGLLLFAPQMSLRDLLVLSLILVVSIAMHNSHFYICMFLAVLLLLGSLLKSIKEKFNNAGIKLKKIVLVILLLVISNLFLSLVHYTYGGGFKASRGGPIFLMGNLVEMGLIDTYLAENCDQKQYELCAYKDSIPNNFLWAENSPIYIGGWGSNKDEYTSIIKDIVTTPKYLKAVVFKSAILSIKQFFHFDTGEAEVPKEWVSNTIIHLYPNHGERFLNARQSTDRLGFNFVNHTQKLIWAACLLACIIIFMLGKMEIKYRLLIVFILLALFINAAICGSFSGAYPRYQSRVVWLLPLPLLLYAAGKLDIKKMFRLIIGNERKKE